MLTDEQKQQRLGKFCASENEAICKPKGLGQGGETYVLKKTSEYITGMPEPESTSVIKSLEWGDYYEPYAKEHFTKATGITFEDRNEVITEGMLAGTLDGLHTDFGLEFKCPYKPEEHLRNLVTDSSELKKTRSLYYWQMVTYFLLTGKRRWKFISYDPRYEGKNRMVIFDITIPDEDKNFFLERIKLATDMYNGFVNKLS